MLILISSIASADTIKCVSVANNGDESNGYSDFPSISADGRFVTFVSEANNLVSGDTNESKDIFVRDLQNKKNAACFCIK